MKLFRKWLPEYARKPVLVLVLFQILVYNGSRLFTWGLPHISLESRWDAAIPFLPWTVIIYLGSYVFWVVNVILCVRFDKNRAYRFFCADILMKAVTLLFFVFMPTTNTRPVFYGTDFWSWAMRAVFALDTPDNLFPSLHCSLSWLCICGMWKEPKIPKGYKAFSLVFCLMIFLSTLTTKQHVPVDVLGGWLLAALCWRVSGDNRLVNSYRRCFEK